MDNFTAASHGRISSASVTRSPSKQHSLYSRRLVRSAQSWHGGGCGRDCNVIAVDGSSVSPPRTRCGSPSAHKRVMMQSRDKESLLEEIMILKKALTEQSVHLKHHKVRASSVESENRKLEKDIEDLEMKGSAEAPRTGGSSRLRAKLQGLKTRLGEFQNTCDLQQEEICNLRKHIRVTHARELEVERDVFAGEIARLQKVVKRLKTAHAQLSCENKELCHIKKRATKLDVANQQLEICIKAVHKSLDKAKNEVRANRQRASELSLQGKMHEKKCKELQEYAASLENHLERARNEKQNTELKLMSMETKFEKLEIELSARGYSRTDQRSDDYSHQSSADAWEAAPEGVSTFQEEGFMANNSISASLMNEDVHDLIPEKENLLDLVNEACQTTSRLPFGGMFISYEDMYLKFQEMEEQWKARDGTVAQKATVFIPKLNLGQVTGCDIEPQSLAQVNPSPESSTIAEVLSEDLTPVPNLPQNLNKKTQSKREFKEANHTFQRKHQLDQLNHDYQKSNRESQEKNESSRDRAFLLNIDKRLKGLAEEVVEISVDRVLEKLVDKVERVTSKNLQVLTSLRDDSQKLERGKSFSEKSEKGSELQMTEEISRDQDDESSVMQEAEEVPEDTVEDVIEEIVNNTTQKPPSLKFIKNILVEGTSALDKPAELPKQCALDIPREPEIDVPSSSLYAEDTKQQIQPRFLLQKRTSSLGFEDTKVLHELQIKVGTEVPEGSHLHDREYVAKDLQQFTASRSSVSVVDKRKDRSRPPLASKALKTIEEPKKESPLEQDFQSSKQSTPPEKIVKKETVDCDAYRKEAAGRSQIKTELQLDMVQDLLNDISTQIDVKGKVPEESSKQHMVMPPGDDQKELEITDNRSTSKIEQDRISSERNRQCLEQHSARNDIKIVERVEQVFDTVSKKGSRSEMLSEKEDTFKNQDNSRKGFKEQDEIGEISDSEEQSSTRTSLEVRDEIEDDFYSDPDADDADFSVSQKHELEDATSVDGEDLAINANISTSGSVRATEETVSGDAHSVRHLRDVFHDRPRQEEAILEEEAEDHETRYRLQALVKEVLTECLSSSYAEDYDNSSYAKDYDSSSYASSEGRGPANHSKNITLEENKVLVIQHDTHLRPPQEEVVVDVLTKCLSKLCMKDNDCSSSSIRKRTGPSIISVKGSSSIGVPVVEHDAVLAHPMSDRSLYERDIVEEVLRQCLSDFYSEYDINIPSASGNSRDAVNQSISGSALKATETPLTEHPGLQYVLSDVPSHEQAIVEEVLSRVLSNLYSREYDTVSSVSMEADPENCSIAGSSLKGDDIPVVGHDSPRHVTSDMSLHEGAIVEVILRKLLTSLCSEDDNLISSATGVGSCLIGRSIGGGSPMKLDKVSVVQHDSNMRNVKLKMAPNEQAIIEEVLNKCLCRIYAENDDKSLSVNVDGRDPAKSFSSESALKSHEVFSVDNDAGQHLVCDIPAHERAIVEEVLRKCLSDIHSTDDDVFLSSRVVQRHPANISTSRSTMKIEGMPFVGQDAGFRDVVSDKQLPKRAIVKEILKKCLSRFYTMDKDGH